MASRKLILFIILDLVVLLLFLLLLAYYGVSHVLFLVLGLLFLVMSAYDNRTDRLSAVLALLFNLPPASGNKRLNWLPLLLSLALIIYSLPLLLEHGLVNSIQRWSMQGGMFTRFAVWSLITTGVVILVAVYTTISSGRKP